MGNAIGGWNDARGIDARPDGDDGLAPDPGPAAWRWSLNWGVVRDDLVIGSCPITAADIDRIHEGTGASALLSVQTDLCRKALGIDHDRLFRHGARRGLEMVYAPMRDFDAPDQRRRLPAAAGALHRLLGRGHRVYVHCTAGFNRSPLTVLAYLTFVEGMTEPDALALLTAGRPEAQPYMEAYAGCRQDLVARCRDDIARRLAEHRRNGAGHVPAEVRRNAERQALRDYLGATATDPETCES